MNGTQRRTLVSHSRMHCMYSGMEKGTSQAEGMSKSEKNQAHSLQPYHVVAVCSDGSQSSKVLPYSDKVNRWGFTTAWPRFTSTSCATVLYRFRANC